MVTSHGGQKIVLDALKLELQAGVSRYGVLETESGPEQQQWALLTTELSLKSPNHIFKGA